MLRYIYIYFLMKNISLFSTEEYTILEVRKQRCGTNMNLSVNEYVRLAWMVL